MDSLTKSKLIREMVEAEITLATLNVVRADLDRRIIETAQRVELARMRWKEAGGNEPPSDADVAQIPPAEPQPPPAEPQEDDGADT